MLRCSNVVLTLMLRTYNVVLTLMLRYRRPPSSGPVRDVEPLPGRAQQPDSQPAQRQ